MMASRSCTRCGKDLTDAASMLCGVGPVCRKMDNHLFATTLAADRTTAQASFATLDWTVLPTVTHHTLARVDAALQADTNDWRVTIKQVEWVLSHGLPVDQQVKLYNAVNALGYIGLVSMWKGEAAKGVALVLCENGRLWVKGPNNAAGRESLKKIQGRVYHPKTGVSAPAWSVPASQWAAFELTILLHWPNNEGLADALAAAKAVTPAPTAPAVKAKPAVTLTEANGFLLVATPYNADFVSALKMLPYKDRKWDRDNKVWAVNTSHTAKVTQLVADFFGKAAA